MLQYKALSAQSLWDICLNTYGTFDLMLKLLTDNNIANINASSYSGQQFTWDETLTANQVVNQISQNANIIYATKVLLNGSVRSVVQSQGGVQYNPISPDYYQPANPATMIKYQQTSETQYTGAGGETSIVLSQLVGTSIIQITRETQPLKTADYGFNSNSGQITLTGDELAEGETLYIIYGQIVTS
jgi:hypothetical protein